MKRHILLIIVICYAMVTMGEMRVSSEEAKEVVTTYYQHVKQISKGECRIGEPESFTLLGKAEMWLVPVNDSWILVSSDKRTEAILARFSTKEKPDLKSYPRGAQYLISCFEYDIAYARDSCADCPINAQWKQLHKMISPTQQTKALPSYVEPLLGNLAWNQYGNESTNPDCNKVYNKYCPAISTINPDMCGHAVVGCVAVAIGQIMRNWEWPYMADIPTTIGGSIREKHFYEWSDMPSYLSNTSPIEHVNMTASFLRDCGYDLNMSYGESSGANNISAFNSFLHFGYDEEMLLYIEKNHTMGWTNKLYSELSANRPVYYTGINSGDEGHAFVLDGYDSAGLFHVNLGWGIGYNDYYNISSYTFSFCYSQAAICGIQPDAHSYCDPAIVTSPISNPYWGIVRAGNVTLDGVIMYSNANCRVYSSTEIRLSTGTEIRNGSYAIFSIKEVPCSSFGDAMLSKSSDDTGLEKNSEIAYIEEVCSLTLSPNPAKDIVRVQSDCDLMSIELYTIDGHCVMRGSQTELYISHLPTGIYFVRVQTTSGRIIQKKILHI